MIKSHKKCVSLEEELNSNKFNLKPFSNEIRTKLLLRNDNDILKIIANECYPNKFNEETLLRFRFHKKI